MEILKGCAQAAAEYDLDVMLTGREAEIRRVAEENEISLNRMEHPDKSTGFYQLVSAP